MRETQPKLKKLGVRIGCVVQGTPEEAQRYCGRWKAIACIPDPDRASYKAMGFPRGGLKDISYGAGVTKATFQAMRKGFRGGLRGSLEKSSDWFQLPGAALISADGTLLWLHRGTHMGDLPDADALLAAADTHLSATD